MDGLLSWSKQLPARMTVQVGESKTAFTDPHCKGIISQLSPYFWPKRVIFGIQLSGTVL